MLRIIRSIMCKHEGGRRPCNAQQDGRNHAERHFDGDDWYRCEIAVDCGHGVGRIYQASESAW